MVSEVIAPPGGANMRFYCPPQGKIRQSRLNCLLVDINIAAGTGLIKKNSNQFSSFGCRSIPLQQGSDKKWFDSHFCRACMIMVIFPSEGPTQANS